MATCHDSQVDHGDMDRLRAFTSPALCRENIPKLSRSQPRLSVNHPVAVRAQDYEIRETSLVDTEQPDKPRADPRGSTAERLMPWRCSNPV